MIALTARLRLFLRENQGYYALLQYSSPTKIYNLILTELLKTKRSSYVASYPYKMILDTNNVCNLKCRYCPTGAGVAGRPKGFMTFDHFKSIIDEMKEYLYIVDLFNWGEPLLNKDLHKMIAYAESNDICTNIHSNFNCDISTEYAERIIRSGLSFLTVSLDGADQEVYADYRRGGDFEKALNNARLFIELKRKLKQNKPFITWQFLVFPHNRHQVESARALAHNVGFDSFRVLAGVVTGGLTAGNKTHDDLHTRMKDIEKSKCDWLWTTATFHWDGAVGPCCLQFKQEDDFGSLKNNHFRNIWNNDKYAHARQLASRRRKNINAGPKIICEDCFKVK